jgi:hypothetical protein
VYCGRQYLSQIEVHGFYVFKEEILISHPGKESATEIILTNGVR